MAEDLLPARRTILVAGCPPWASALVESLQVLVAADAAAALAMLVARAEVSVLVIDAALPQVNEACITRLRGAGDPRLARVPVLAVGTDVECAAVLAAGATDAVARDIDAASMQRRVNLLALLGESGDSLAELRAQIAQRATTDPATGLATRHMLLTQGAQMLAYTKRHRSHLAALRLDLDGFAALAANHGAEVSGRAAAQVARRLRQLARKEDVLAGAGEGRYAILAPRTKVSSADTLAQRLLDALAAERFSLGGNSLQFTASIGVATSSEEPAETIEELLLAAEERVATAHAQGGARVVRDDTTPVSALPDLEQALAWLRAGDYERLNPHLAHVARRLLPLLKLCHSQFNFAVPSDVNRPEPPANKRHLN